MKIGETIIINNDIQSNNAALKAMRGRKARIIDIFINPHEKKLYFKLDIDKGMNIWSRNMIVY